jgi:hypothetical protein
MSYYIFNGMNKRYNQISAPLPPTGLAYTLALAGGNNATCNITYNYIAGLTYNVSVIDNSNNNYTVSGGNGTATFTFPIEPTMEIYTITVTATNTSNLSSSSIITFTEEHVIAPQNLSYSLNGNICTITFTAISSFSYTVTALDSNSVSYTPTGSNGNYTFTLVNNPTNFSITVTAYNIITSAASSVVTNNFSTPLTLSTNYTEVSLTYGLPYNYYYGGAIGYSTVPPGEFVTNGIGNLAMSADGTYIVAARVYFPNYTGYFSNNGVSGFNNILTYDNLSDGTYSLIHTFVSPNGMVVIVYPYGGGPIFYSSNGSNPFRVQVGINTPYMSGGGGMTASSYNSQILIVTNYTVVGWTNNGNVTNGSVPSFTVLATLSSSPPFGNNGLPATGGFNSVSMSTTGQYCIITTVVIRDANNNVTAPSNLYYSNDTNSSMASSITFTIIPSSNFPASSNIGSWISAVISGDGSKIVAAESNGGIWISNSNASNNLPKFTKLYDYTINNNPYSISMSYSGMVIAMCNLFTVLISINGGLTFTTFYINQGVNGNTVPPLTTTSQTNIGSIPISNSIVTVTPNGNIVACNLHYATYYNYYNRQGGSFCYFFNVS